MRILPMLLICAASAAACAARGPELRQPVGLTMVTSASAADSGEDAAAESTSPCEADELPMIEFDYASSDLRRKEALELKRLASCLTSPPHETVSVVLIGYADLVGTVPANLVLGLERAKTVMRQLIEDGVSPARLVVASAGELQRPRARWGLQAHRVEVLLARGGPPRPDEAPIARGIDAQGLLPRPRPDVGQGPPRRLVPPQRSPYMPRPPVRRYVPPPRRR